MLFELLQDVLRIDARIGIVKTRDKTERYLVVLRAVNPCSSVLVKAERITHRVNHFTAIDATRRQFPQLLHADAVGLRIALVVEQETADQLLRERASAAFREDDDFGLQVVAGLEIRLLLAVLVDAFVIGANAEDAAFFKQQFGSGKPSEHGYAGRFHLAAQPLNEMIDRDHIVAVIAQRRRRDWQLELP